MKNLRFARPKINLAGWILVSFMFMVACAQAEKPGESKKTPIKIETVTPETGPLGNDTSPEIPSEESGLSEEVVLEKEEIEATKPTEVKKETPKQESAQEEIAIEQEGINKSTSTVDVPKAESEDAVEEIPEPAPQTAPSHVIWDGLLRKHVSSSGQVDYSALKGSKDILQSYLDLLADNPPRSDWSRNEKMAYWINAYNAFTVKMIIDNYPVGSITDLHGGKPWDVKWIKLGGKTYSLNQIENDILRPIYKDARIHFAVNCAAKSCPPLLNQAFTASNLNAQLESQAKAFVNNQKYNTLSSSSVKISKIFDWYEVDFGNVITYLNDYSNTVVNKGATINYRDYNWMLNGL